MSLKVKLEDGAHMPYRATNGSAGMDLKVKLDKDFLRCPAKATISVNTGVCVQIPDGHVGFLVARSSLHKKKLMLANNIGIIDSDYRGPLVVKLYNYSESVQVLENKERIVQLVIVPVMVPSGLNIVSDLDETDRGSGGFGSTGK